MPQFPHLVMGTVTHSVAKRSIYNLLEEYLAHSRATGELAVNVTTVIMGTAMWGSQPWPRMEHS